MNFGNSFTFEEGVTHLIAIGIYGILFFIALIWLWITKPGRPLLRRTT